MKTWKNTSPATAFPVSTLVEALANVHITYPNPDEGEDRVYLLGITASGRLIKASLEPTDEPGTWRPVTAFPATSDDTALFNKYVP
jgi:hypothetical protein